MHFGVREGSLSSPASPSRPHHRLGLAMRSALRPQKHFLSDGVPPVQSKTFIPILSPSRPLAFDDSRLAARRSKSYSSFRTEKLVSLLTGKVAYEPRLRR